MLVRSPRHKGFYLDALTGVRYLSSILNSIQAVKASALEFSLFKRYNKLRDAEIREMVRYRSRWAYTGVFHNG